MNCNLGCGVLSVCHSLLLVKTKSQVQARDRVGGQIA